MFAKPYKLKSNNTLKNTEKKNLVQRIQNDFPSVPEAKIKELVPNKSNTSCMKLTLHSEELVGVYVVDGVPVMVEVGDALVPTLCALWKLPGLVPTLTIHTEVLPKVQGGAPLYAPGVTVPAPNSGTFLPTFSPGGIIACCTGDNAAAAIVGKSLMSSGDLIFRQGGVLMETIHVLGDQLCKDTKFSRIVRPNLGRPKYESASEVTTNMAQLSIQRPREEWPALGGAPSPPPPRPARVAPALIREPNNNPQPAQDSSYNSIVLDDSTTAEEGPGVPEDMDGLLRWCLLSFMKRDGKTVKLPLKTNLLYRNHLMPLCPPDRTLDVKKSSYKKMSKFMEAMQQEGLLEVREIERGVDALVALQAQHAAVRAHTHAHAHADTHTDARGDVTRPHALTELVCVTAAVADLLAPHRKGEGLTSAQVRAAVTEYVRARGLADTGGAVRVDAGIARVTGKPLGESIRWEELMNAVHAKMTASTQVRRADGGVALVRSRLPPVTMHVVTRSGNKKVTLVSNLGHFGVEVGGLARECQVGAAAACSVARGPAGPQLLLQGDQTHFVAKLLIEKYGLPKKYLEGADKALNKKK